jgi:branched-chain amino acid transport system substrate-binding protein
MNAKMLGLKKTYILNDKEAYGQGVATNFKNSLVSLGLTPVGFTAWNGKASSYTGLATQIKAKHADSVFLGGLICENGGKLVKDLRAVLGPTVTILAPDGFTPISAVVAGAGTDANNMIVSVAGQPNSNLPQAGKTFVQNFGATQPSNNVDPYSSYAAQATQVLLSAIEKSDGTRASVASNLLHTKVTNGILGNFTINSNGDTSNNPVTMYKIVGGKQTTDKTITPPQSLVKKS